MNLEEMKQKLKDIGKISFSKEFIEKAVKIRGIPESEVIKNLKQLDKLIFAEDRGDEEKGHKYALLFSKSNKYDLKVVISIKDNNLNVITSHVQNIKRRKVLEKWLRMQR